MKNYQKVYCINLEFRPVHTSWMLPFVCRDDYYCKLTKELCVANSVSRFRWEARIIPELVRRCPSRKTVEDLLNEKKSVVS